MISQKPVLREHVTHFKIQFHQSVGVIETVSQFMDLLEEAKNDMKNEDMPLQFTSKFLNPPQTKM